MIATIVTLCFGLFLGLRHTFEPDHLAAVSNLVTAKPRAGIGAAIIGAVWGIGHGASLLAVGLVLGLFRAQLPAHLAEIFELMVAAMLVVLGGRSLFQCLMTRRTSSCLLTDAAADHDHASRVSRWPLLVGMMHGLAGSGALTALAMASLHSLRAQLAYMGLFGLGCVMGMAAMTALASWPLHQVTERHWAARFAMGMTGGVSLLLGFGQAAPSLTHLATW